MSTIVDGFFARPGLRRSYLTPATPAQVEAIVSLGGHPAVDLTCSEASKAINALKRRKGCLR